MDKLGIVLRTSGSRRLILRTKIKVKTGTQVLNDELTPIGRIFDVFGPIKNPYVSVEPLRDDIERYVGHSLYVMGKNEKEKIGKWKK